MFRLFVCLLNGFNVPAGFRDAFGERSQVGTADLGFAPLRSVLQSHNNSSRFDVGKQQITVLSPVCCRPVTMRRLDWTRGSLMHRTNQCIASDLNTDRYS